MVHLFYVVIDQFHIGCYKFVKLVLDSTTVLGNILHLVHPQKPTFVFLYTHAFFMESVKASASHLIILPVSDDWHTQSICPSLLFSLFLVGFCVCCTYYHSTD